MKPEDIGKLSSPKILDLISHGTEILNQRKKRTATQKNARAVWSDELKEEIDFWDKVISGVHERDAESFKKRAQTHEKIRFQFFEFFDNPTTRPLKVLDVGAGPISQIGLSNPSGPIELTAIDPLADEYNSFLDSAGILPKVRTQKGCAEDLAEMFEANSFDLVFSKNALDHAYSPLDGIKQMFKLCRPGGLVHIEGRANVGEHNFYAGLHQWNFMAVEGDMVVWRPTEQHSVQKTLGSTAIVQATNRNNCGAWLQTCRILKTS